MSPPTNNLETCITYIRHEPSKKQLETCITYIRHEPSNKQLETCITYIRHEPSNKQLEVQTNQTSCLCGNRNGHHNTELRS
jgi:hypothetical protein